MSYRSSGTISVYSATHAATTCSDTLSARLVLHFGKYVILQLFFQVVKSFSKMRNFPASKIRLQNLTFLKLENVKISN
jgi:hypothetical protein